MTHCFYSFRIRFLYTFNTSLLLLHVINPMVFCTCRLLSSSLEGSKKLKTSFFQPGGKGLGRLLHASCAVPLKMHCPILPDRRPFKHRLALTLTYPQALCMQLIKLSYRLSESISLFYVISQTARS
jgi:hypothetical protein